MTKNRMGGAVGSLAAAGLLLFAGACADDGPTVPAMPDMQAEVELAIAASSLRAPVGSDISVAVRAVSAEDLGGVQAYLSFDPDELEYVGQIADRDAIVVVNDSEAEAGVLRFASFSPRPLTPNTAKFAFRVLRDGYAGSMELSPEVVGSYDDQTELSFDVASAVEADGHLAAVGQPVDWDFRDWAEFWDPSIADAADEAGPMNIAGLPTDGAIYGDATLDGTVNVLDASATANAGLGNIEIIIGTETSGRDFVTAANVRPVAGACTVGREGADCATRTLNVLDASPIAIEGTPGGADQPVVSDAIALPKAIYTSGDTVILAGQTITGTFNMTADKIYRLEGIVTVGDETTGAAGAGVLNVAPGTRVEGTEAGALFISRNGQIFADGTPTQPVVFSCVANQPNAPAGQARYPQCWGGVFIAGNAVVNEQDTGLASGAPVIPGRNPVGGENQREGEGGAVNFGGGNDADNSGTLRFARFEYGGKQVATNNELNNLTIGACGTGTILEHIQVHGGSDDGLEIFGGRCDVKYLYATANDDDQFDYSFGYDGRVQFVIIQMKSIGTAGGDRGFEVDNTETAATYNNAPRVNPQVYNVTIVGGAPTVHFNYRRGAGGTLRNMLLVQGTDAFKLDNGDTCTALSIDNTRVLGLTGSLITGSAACSPSVVGSAVTQAAFAGTELRDALSVLNPDFRPSSHAAVGGTAVAVPADGWFVPATFIGAVAQQGSLKNAIPWYSGWTIPWQSATAP